MSYQNCVSAEGSGALKTVAETAAQIKALKRDPANQIVVAAITGPKGPYEVHWQAAPSGVAEGPWPKISNSCNAADGSYADPSVRVTELVQHFGNNGVTLSICDAEFAPALQVIAQKIEILLKPPCIEGQVATRPGTSVPDCTVTSHTRTNGMLVNSPVRRARTMAALRRAGTWSPARARARDGRWKSARDPNAPPATSQDATVDCALCVPGVSAPERGCP